MTHKIAFMTHKGFVENMHAEMLDDGNFCLDNIPFHTKGISYCDEFSVKIEDDRLFFNFVTKRGGHSTYRIKMLEDCSHEEFMKFWPQFARFGCTFEGSNLGSRRLYAVDIPPGADVHAIYDLLERGEEAGQWEFEEGHYAG